MFIHFALSSSGQEQLEFPLIFALTVATGVSRSRSEICNVGVVVTAVANDFLSATLFIHTTVLELYRYLSHRTCTTSGSMAVCMVS